MSSTCAGSCAPVRILIPKTRFTLVPRELLQLGQVSHGEAVLLHQLPQVISAPNDQ